jgi:hypothetical protein
VATDAAATMPERHRARRHRRRSQRNRCRDRKNFLTHQISPFSAVTGHGYSTFGRRNGCCRRRNGYLTRSEQAK